jgi:hypothetical protein
MILYWYKMKCKSSKGNWMKSIWNKKLTISQCLSRNQMNLVDLLWNYYKKGPWWKEEIILWVEKYNSTSKFFCVTFSWFQLISLYCLIRVSHKLIEHLFCFPKPHPFLASSDKKVGIVWAMIAGFWYFFLHI